jgi:DNA-directed RNA polymerase subunit RPC12/RpoP
MTDEYVCPNCWQPYKETDVVGKTTAVKGGVRSTYEVVRCTCGKIFRGRKVAEKILK